MILKYAVILLSITLAACSPEKSQIEPNQPPFRAKASTLEIFNNSSKQYEPLFLTGINLSVATPGTYAGELVATRDQYERWLKLIADAGINSIRTYTLHFPRFYDVLNKFNKNRVSQNLAPIYLIQGVWLDEEFSENNKNDFFEFSAKYQQAIYEVIDAIHGNIEIDHRFGQAHGIFDIDASPWVMAYIIGREIYPEEVASTNLLNSDINSYDGNALSINNASPTETWVTQRLDDLISYEREYYQTERPVSLSSWPTLDPLNHPTEQSLEDSENIDLVNIDDNNAPAGIFYSFHAYPYYPDFISEDNNYRQYEDATGPNSYLGYLIDLKAHYSNRPLIIAEFGVPSSWGNIHTAHNGIHHGGLNEEEQGDSISRMLNNMLEANTGGGMLFAFIDEWWKPTWLTNEFDFPFDRRAYWHNVLAPEQNYGLLAFAPERSEYVTLNQSNTIDSWTGNEVYQLQASFDSEFFHVNLALDRTISSDDELIIGFDTYDSGLGEVILPAGNATQGIKTNQGNEFSLRIFFEENKWKAYFFVTPAYDLFGLWNNEHDPQIQMLQSISSEGSGWNLLQWKTNYSLFPDPSITDTFYGISENTIDTIGILGVQELGEPLLSDDAILLNDQSISLRIPWGLLQFSDPAQLQVFHDETSSALIGSKTSEGIAVAVVMNNILQGESERFSWTAWDDRHDMPNVEERIKPAYYLYQQAITALNL